MSRPESHYDLPEHELEPRPVLMVHDHEILAATPGAMAAYWQLVDLLRAADPLIIVDVHDVKRRLTDDELDAKLGQAQRTWDEGRDEYKKFVDTGELPTYRWKLNRYCTAEGLGIGFETVA